MFLFDIFWLFHCLLLNCLMHTYCRKKDVSLLLLNMFKETVWIIQPEARSFPLPFYRRNSLEKSMLRYHLQSNVTRRIQNIYCLSLWDDSFYLNFIHQITNLFNDQSLDNQICGQDARSWYLCFIGFKCFYCDALELSTTMCHSQHLKIYLLKQLLFCESKYYHSLYSSVVN